MNNKMLQRTMRNEFYSEVFPFFNKRDLYMQENKLRSFTKEEEKFFSDMKIIGDAMYSESVGYSKLIKLCNDNIENAEEDYFKKALIKMKNNFIAKRKEARVIYRRVRYENMPGGVEEHIRSTLAKWTFRIETRLFRDMDYSAVDEPKKRKRL